MRLVRFRGQNVHGYLTFDVVFNKRITFLIGLNGTGKTTVVRAVHALIDPRLSILASIKHESMRVDLEQDGKRIAISSSTTEQGTTLSIRGVADTLTIPAFVMPAGEPPHRTVEFEAKYYEEQSTKHATHPVVQRLAQMSTPMYLGLERRTAMDRTSDSWAMYQRYRMTQQRYARTIFGGSLSASVGQAEALAEWKHQLALQAENLAANELREKFIAASFKIFDAAPSAPDRWEEKFPTQRERLAIMARRDAIHSTLAALGSHGPNISKAVDTYFDRLGEIFAHLPTRGSLGAAFGREDLSKKEKAALAQWTFNSWQYDRVQSTIAEVDHFIAQRSEAYAAVDAYREAVNSFLSETEKQVLVDTQGLRVRLGKGQERPIGALSSGEQQIVVLLTHLAFNPAAKAAGVLIIDEPELSLHVSWQEKFASAVLKTDPDLQVILATHSPTIILDRVEDCVEL